MGHVSSLYIRGFPSKAYKATILCLSQSYAYRSIYIYILCTILRQLNFVTMSSNTNEPSLLSGHAQYAKGYVSETVGNVTGSTEWKESGKRDAQSGLEEMKV